MKKMLSISLLFSFVTSPAFSADFSPTVLGISAPSFVQYDYDRSELAIPFTISGHPANVIFLVFTRDKASKIGSTQNGYLGWHYVNRIDTCLFTGTPRQCSIGNNVITWDGKDSDGAYVEKDENIYYIWGFDNVGLKTPVTRQIKPDPWGRITVMTRDEKDNLLARPVIWAGSGDRGGGGATNTIPREHINKKWIVGNDPMDDTLMETCKSYEVCDPGGLAFLPSDYTYFFKCGLSNKGFKELFKWKWVPNGDAVLQTSWGEEGKFIFFVSSQSSWEFGPGVVSDGGSCLLVTTGVISDDCAESELIYVDVNDGTEIKRYDLSNWWIDPADAEKGGQGSGGPTELSMWGRYAAIGAHSTCINMLFDVQYENEEDAIAWFNQNGDYTGDRNFEIDSERPWVCIDDQVGPFKYNIAIEKNGFSFFPSFGIGAVSFGLYAPDGTGLGYHAFMGETASQKYDMSVITGGTAYDGMLVTDQPVGGTGERNGWYWIGQDSFKGVISSKPVAVDESAPPVFTVAQNSPNPFNPATTIGFTLPDAGTVSVEVLNVNGQRVDTIANEFMSAGRHSVTWNASGFSAGIYFYTVNADGFSMTNKMTLLK
ncbi:T9SS type A sorting domain-containing protein [bacterium]|nr:T9SS type A sorting domain-containing protein [bacterium]